MNRRLPRSTRTDPRFPSTPLFLSPAGSSIENADVDAGRLHGDCISMVRWRSSWTGLRRFCTVARSTAPPATTRSEEHTSELQSLMRISYAVFCLKKKKKTQNKNTKETKRAKRQNNITSNSHN